VLARPPSAAYRLRKLLRRHREKVVVATVLLVLALGAAVAQWIAACDRSLQARDAGETHAAAFLSARDERSSLVEKLRAVSESYEWWQPPWERREEIEALGRLRHVHASLESSYGEALRSFQLAEEAAPFGSRLGLGARRRLEALLFERLGEALEDGSVQLPADFFKGQIERLGLGTYAAQLEDRSRFQLETDPPGAEVHLFRYEEVELRLRPLPFARGKPGEPVLRVERVWDAERSPFAAGDRLVEVRGVATRTEGDLARALEPVGLDEAVQVTLLRGGATLQERWVPFPGGPLHEGHAELRAGRLIDPYLQLGITFEGYPLELGEGSLAGTTAAGTRLELELPRGSYLLLVRKEGFVDQRLPLFAPWDAGFTRVRLWRNEEVPPGFVPVAGGLFRAGGDDGAYEPLPRQRAPVGDFLMARCEVTRREYHELLNDLVARGLLGEDGTISPRADWTLPELKDFAPLPEGGEKPRIRVVPEYRGTVLFDRGPDGTLFAPPKSPERPVVAVSMQAAVEYAHWLTEKHGGRWRFRLPRDLEWERAARGADARIFVWGDRLVRSLCRGRGTSLKERIVDTPEDIATHPADESPFGVRDLAGSASEPTLARPLQGERLYVYRGANWDATSALDFHAATRNRILPGRGYAFVGIRLVAERP
jgi:formylglycine-generating enzyme required for sulfatase activity